MSLTKNPQTPTKKFSFECNLEDCPIRLSPWTAFSSAIGGGARALVRQLTTAGFRLISKYEYIMYRNPALKVLTRVSPKNGMHRSLQWLKILYIHNCWKLFFVPEPLPNLDKTKTYQTSKY